MAKLIDVIKYEGDNSTFIWKHPREDFNAFSQLIVHESQEAVFYSNGRALDLFGPGRYTLKTQNLPLVRKVIGTATGGLSPFHCEVYFINKAEQMSIKWGTDSRVQFIEPTYNFPLSIGASGEMTIQVADSRKLLVKLVSTEHDFSREHIENYFSSFLMARVKTYFAQTIRAQKINVFEIDEKLSVFSDEIRALLSPDFADYGLTLRKFIVSRVIRPEGEKQYEKFKELHFRRYSDIEEARIQQEAEVIRAETEAQKTVIHSQAQATKRSQEGYTYSQERAFDVAEKVAENEAVGEFTNMGVGMGTMAGVGGAVGGMVSGMMSETLASSNQAANQNKSVIFCEQCGAQLPVGALFCDQCGAQIVSGNVCMKCGFIFERPGKFCPRCGAKRV